MGKLYVHSQFFVIYGSVKAKFFRLSHDVVTCDVDRDVSTAYCQSSSGNEVDWSCVIL